MVIATLLASLIVLCAPTPLQTSTTVYAYRLTTVLLFPVTSMTMLLPSWARLPVSAQGRRSHRYACACGDSVVCPPNITSDLLC